MKYTIELTPEELEVFKAVRQFIYDKTDMLNHENSNFEQVSAIPMKESPAYKKGFEDGTKWAIDENAKDHQGYYDNGYNNALEDLAHAMKVYFPLNSEERIIYFGTNIQVERYARENPRDLIAMAKAYEKKKKTDEIKVGDEVITGGGTKAVVTRVVDNCVRVMFEDGSGFRDSHAINGLKKTGRHFDEVEQLLNKLRGKEE